MILFDVKLRSMKHNKFGFTKSISYLIFWVQEVVVKVQMPGLKDLFDIDLKDLRASVI